MARVGRPLSLTQEHIDTVCDAIADGMSQTAASGLAGIDPRTFERWVARGWEISARVDAGECDDGVTGDEALLLELCRRRAHARAVCQRGLIDTGKSGDKHAIYWASWMLERSFRNDFGRESRQELQRTAHEATSAKVDADAKPARTKAEIRKLEAEATAAEAKARLADQQSKSLADGLTVDLTCDDGDGITGDVTAEYVAQVTPTEIGVERE